jgi:hypothetical protein
MADNLETYFKKHLTEENPGEDNWNVPSDEVWENVLPEIQKTKGVFVPWKYLYIIGGIIAIILLALFFWPSNSPVNTNEKIESITTIEEKTKNEITQPISTETTENLPSEAERNTIETKQNNTETKQNTAEKSETTDYAKEPINNVEAEVTKTAESNNYSSSKQENLNIEDKAQNQGSFLTITKYGSQNEEAQITRLTPRTFDFLTVTIADNSLLSNSNQPVSQIDLPDEKKEPFDNKGKFGIGIFYAPAFTSTNLKGNPNSGEIETSNQLFYTNNWGLEVKYFISNRFSLYVGLGRSEVNTFSKSLTDFNYDLSTEHLMPDGAKENTSPVMMLTPFGDVSTEITYQFPGSAEIPNGEQMYSVIETDQQVRYLAIPFGAEYNILRFSHFDWFASGELNYNRALKDATQFSSRIVHHGSDMDVVAEKMMGNPAFTKSYLGFDVGTGLNYQFSKSFQISGSANYFGNITKVNVQDNMSTYVNGFNLKIGIFYLF